MKGPPWERSGGSKKLFMLQLVVRKSFYFSFSEKISEIFSLLHNSQYISSCRRTQLAHSRGGFPIDFKGEEHKVANTLCTNFTDNRAKGTLLVFTCIWLCCIASFVTNTGIFWRWSWNPKSPGYKQINLLSLLSSSAFWFTKNSDSVWTSYRYIYTESSNSRVLWRLQGSEYSIK